MITTLPFKTCDESNFGMSKFCKMYDETDLPDPKIWGKLVRDKISGMKNQPQYLSSIMSNERTRNAYIFSNVSLKYDAYEKDIAVLQIFFDRPTAFQFTRCLIIKVVNVKANMNFEHGLMRPKLK